MSDNDLLRSIHHELVRITEHQSEMLAMELHSRDLAMGTDTLELAYEDLDKEILDHHPEYQDGDYVDLGIEGAWQNLHPCVRTAYRRNARGLMAERSYQG